MCCDNKYSAMDIVLLTLPRLELRAPIIAPAILKAAVEKHGFTSYCYDLNMDLWSNIDKSTLGHVWFDTDLTFRYEDKFSSFWEEVLSPHVDRWIDKLRSLSPKWIGITIFSQRSRWITIKLCERIRKDLPQVKIITGGTYAEFLSPELYEKKLTDAYVIGEGEEALVSILKGQLDFPGVNGKPPQQINDLDNIPLPDYSDYDFSKYPAKWFDPRKEPEGSSDSIYITGSRGCIRKCTFCDVVSIWPKFRYRSGQSMAEEMMLQNQKYGSKTFLFTDSLINGSVKQLEDLCMSLIVYKEKGMIDKDIVWQGQFIARSPAQMGENVYAMMKEAGCHYVSIGVESGSEKVRGDMKKMFTDADMDFTFKMCAKYGIKMVWLLLVGYPTETEEDFEKTLNLLDKYYWLNTLGLVKTIALGPTLEILPGSPLWNMKDDMGIEWDQTKNWVLGNNTREVRIKRWLRLREKCIKLDYNIVEKATDHLLKELEEIGKIKIKTSDVYDHFNEIDRLKGKV